MGNVYSEPSVISLLEVLRSAIVYHILFIPHLFAGDGPDGESKCITYIHVDITLLNNIYYKPETVWGTNIEMACLVHILRSPIYCYHASQCYHYMGSLFYCKRYWPKISVYLLCK